MATQGSAFASGQPHRIRARHAGASGPRLVLIHELGGSIDSWEQVIAQVDDRLRATAYDQRGAGAFAPVPVAFSMDTQIDDLIELLDTTAPDEPVWLAGVAAGSRIALGAAARAPQRVRGIIALAPTIGPGQGVAALLGRARTVRAGGMAALADDALANSYPGVLRDPIVFARYRDTFLRQNPSGYAAIAEALAHCADVDLASIACPCLLVAGALDPMCTPERTAAIAGRLAHAELHTIHSGHLAHVQTAALVAKMMADFIARWES